MNAANPKSNIQHPKSDRLFTFASGGWIVLVSLVGCMIVAAWALRGAVMRALDPASRPPGDNSTLESYKFDLTNLAVQRELIVPKMHHRDMIPTMDAPAISGPTPDVPLDERWSAMQRLNDPKYGKYLVPADIVIGVTLDGESRAYPLHVLYVHEIINDTLGGTPIAVTYNWPSGAAAVFDRAINADQPRTVEFAHSGLLYNSNLLMYDRNQSRSSPETPPFGGGNETLWSQLLGRPIAGSEDILKSSLTFLPYEVVTWADWSARHPDTTVINRDLGMYERYKDAAPTQYFKSKDLIAPVSPMPPAQEAGGLLPKTRVIAVITSEACRVYPIPYVLDHGTPIADAPGLVEWRNELGGRTLRFVGDRNAQTMRIEVEPPDDQMIAFESFWFAWHAMHPEDELFTP